MPNQERYYQWKSYQADFKMNCQGNCLVTADWHQLTDDDEWIVVACPPKYPLWSQFYIEDYWVVTCHDRWWAIQMQWDVVRIDIRSGIWDRWRRNIEQNIIYNPWIRKWYLIS